MLKNFSIIGVSTRLKNGKIVYCEHQENNIRDEQDSLEHFTFVNNKFKELVKSGFVFSNKTTFGGASSTSAGGSASGSAGQDAGIQTDFFNQAPPNIITGSTVGGPTYSLNDSSWNDEVPAHPLSDYDIEWVVSTLTVFPNGSHTPSSNGGPVTMSGNNTFSSTHQLGAGEASVRWNITITGPEAGDPSVSGWVRHFYNEGVS